MQSNFFSNSATEVPMPTFQISTTAAAATTAPSSAGVQSPTATSYFTWDSGTFGSTDDPFSIGAAARDDPFSAVTATTTTATTEASIPTFQMPATASTPVDPFAIAQHVQSDFSTFHQQPAR